MLKTSEKEGPMLKLNPDKDRDFSPILTSYDYSPHNSGSNNMANQHHNSAKQITKKFAKYSDSSMEFSKSIEMPEKSAHQLSQLAQISSSIVKHNNKKLDMNNLPSPV